MKSRIVDWWIRIRASYWFIPSVMAIAAIFAAIGIVQVDTLLGAEWLLDYQWFYANKPAGARALLSTVAGSMITVAGVTFSMTLLAVSHASAQIGPRLLGGFMRDRGNQMTLGVFIATFLYCLIVLRTVHVGGSAEEATAFVPHLAILVAVALAILSVAVLIYFFHHVPQSINVSNVIARVGDELIDGIHCLYPERIGDARPDDWSSDNRQVDLDDDCRYLPVVGHGGYLRVLDSEGLLEISESNDLVLKMLLRPGDFGIAGQPMVQVGPKEHLDDEVISRIYGLFSWGIQRTPLQDVMFPAEQLIEVLGKAMSPGINGQSTALLCLNQIERAIAELLARSEPDAHRFDTNKKLRVIAKPITHEEFLSLTMRPIRQYIRGDWIATNRVLYMLDRLGRMPKLSHQASRIAAERRFIEQEVLDSQMTALEKSSLGISDISSNLKG